MGLADAVSSVVEKRRRLARVMEDARGAEKPTANLGSNAMLVNKEKENFIL
jgi:hypothetical protein